MPLTSMPFAGFGPRRAVSSGFAEWNRRTNRVVLFFSVNGHARWVLNPESHLVATDLDHGHDDIVPDDDALILLARNDDHWFARL